MRWAILLIMAFASGFVSLSYEVLWARMFSFSAAGSAAAFPMLLGLFLAGIAVGARWSKRFSKGQATFAPGPLRSVAAFVATSSIAGWLVIPVMAWFLTLHEAIPGYTALYFVFGAACLFGAQLPLLMHFGIEANERVGARLSYVYVANIIGSVSGSFITGFFWLDVAPTPQIVTTLTVLGLALATTLFAVTRPAPRQVAFAIVAACVLAIAVVSLKSSVYDGALERLFYGARYEGQRFVHIIENRGGIIAVDDKEVTYSGGVYDGTFSTDIVDDVNGIIRPFSMSAFHPNPKTVLVIGLATGSWSRVIADHPDVERVIVVEINAAYYELLKAFDENHILSHPKVEHHIDDGRRWLNHNPMTYDVIVSNSSFHQRGFSSTLLSEEAFSLMRQRLNPGGVLMVNTTGSQRVLATGCHVFEDCQAFYRAGIFSNAPLETNPQRLRDILTRYVIEGKSVLDLNNPEHQSRLDTIIGTFDGRTPGYFNSEETRKLSEGFETITDSNMGHEWQFDIF